MQDSQMPIHDVQPPHMKDYIHGRPARPEYSGHSGGPSGAVSMVPSPPSKKKKSVLRRLFLVVIAILLCVPFVVGGVFLFLLSPADALSPEKNFTIAQGESVSDIAYTLESQGIVRNAFIFRVLLITQGRASAIKAGDFRLSGALSAWRISEVLTAKAPPQRDSEVTIPEGFTVDEIAVRLLQAGVIKNEASFKNAAVLENCKARELSLPLPCDESGIVSVKNLEGFFFPDTYRFSPRMTAQDIAEKILENFEKRVTPELRAEISSQKKSLKDIITMASLIEEEVRTDSDRALISGILWKRLSIGMALQVDATVLYAKYGGRTLTNEERVLTLADLAIASPYNTYKYPGFPIGPISNSGLASIIAAIRPQTSDYFFYLSTPDGTTIFSKTLEEHNRAKAKYLK